MTDKTKGFSAVVAAGAKRVWSLYYDGFREMTVGKTLWLIIILKVFLFFVVIKLLFFPNILKRDFSTDEERAAHVRNELINK